LAALHAVGEYTPGELAELFRVGRSTVYQALQRVRIRNASTLAVSFQQPEVRTR
jgi:DNA-directed RNA polymerase specialized sigma24 family protein